MFILGLQSNCVVVWSVHAERAVPPSADTDMRQSHEQQFVIARLHRVPDGDLVTLPLRQQWQKS